MMELQESKERFRESLKRAASAARELAKMQKFPLWDGIAKSIDGIRAKGCALAVAKSESKAEIDRQIDSYKQVTNKMSGNKETIQ